jgi:hypothetical protein
MALFSKQVFYCNACGLKCHQPLPNVIGRKWKVCSLECHREMDWRDVLSTMGKEYYPHTVEQDK